MANDYLLVGLGNPGSEYELTRHNIGWLALDAYIDKKTKPGESAEWRNECNALLWTEKRQKHTLHVMKPQTYMNLSLNAVRSFVNRYHIDLDRVLVVYDDIDLPLGRLRIRKNGSGGTHNGMGPITESMGEAIPRLRLGIGPFEKHQDLKRFVLDPFPDADWPIVEKVCLCSADIINAWLHRGLEKAMNQYNSSDFRPQPEAPPEHILDNKNAASAAESSSST